MKSEVIHFAVCLNNDGYPSSLEIGKLYRVISDDQASAEGYLRVVDESGEDYAFAENRFHIVQLPSAVEEKLLAKSEAAIHTAWNKNDGWKTNRLIDAGANGSQLPHIEEIKSLTGKDRLAIEWAKLDKKEEQEMADVGLAKFFK